jgi:hypothetical protein
MTPEQKNEMRIKMIEHLEAALAISDETRELSALDPGEGQFMACDEPKVNGGSRQKKMGDAEEIYVRFEKFVFNLFIAEGFSVERDGPANRSPYNPRGR